MSFKNSISTNLYGLKFLYIFSFIFILIFLLIPLQIVINNSDEVPKFIDVKILLIYLINVTLIYSILFLLQKKFKYFLNNKYVIFLTLVFFVWLLLTGLILPSIGEADSFWSQYSSKFRFRYILIFKLIFTLIFTFIIFKVEILRKNFIKFVFFYLVITLCVSIFLLTKNFLIPNNSFNIKDVLDKFKIGNNNLLVISFDGINGNVFSDLMDEENKEIFKDFNLYSNYTVSFPATYLSLASELTNLSDLNEIKNKQLILNKNKENQNSIFTYGSYNELFDGENKIEEGSYYSNNDLFKFNALIQTVLFPSVSRWGTSKTYNVLQKFRNTNIYNYFLKYFSFSFFEDNLLIKDYYRVNFIEVFKLFDEKNYSQDNTNNAYFFHFTFSHWHILFDKECNYKPYDNGKFSNELQNYEGNIENTQCVIKIIKSIIKSLKDNNIYNQNTIVFKSDHGKPNGYHSIDLYNKGINGNLRWGKGRYNSFVMLKNKNELKQSMTINNKTISSSFLYNFYCEKLPYDVNCIKKQDDQIFIPIYKDTFLDLKEFKKVNLKDFNALNF